MEAATLAGGCFWCTEAIFKRQGPDVGPQYRSAIFYPAEAYHRDFYARNPDYPYSQSVIEPKIEKLEKEFKEDLS